MANPFKKSRKQQQRLVEQLLSNAGITPKPGFNVMDDLDQMGIAFEDIEKDPLGFVAMMTEMVGMTKETISVDALVSRLTNDDTYKLSNDDDYEEYVVVSGCDGCGWASIVPDKFPNKAIATAFALQHNEMRVDNDVPHNHRTAVLQVTYNLILSPAEMSAMRDDFNKFVADNGLDGLMNGGDN